MLMVLLSRYFLPFFIKYSDKFYSFIKTTSFMKQREDIWMEMSLPTYSSQINAVQNTKQLS